MDKDQLAQQLLHLFVEELRDHLAALNQTLVALESDKGDPTRRQERLGALFRIVHIIKGSARAADVSAIERLCHHLETALSAAQGQELPPELFTLFFNAADALEETRRRLAKAEPNQGAPLEELLARLELPAGGPAPTLAASSTAEPDATTLRVSADKLDALLARTIEIFAAQRRFEARSADLLELHEQVLTCRREARRTSRPLQSWLRQQSSEASAGSVLWPLWDSLLRIERQLDRLIRAFEADRRALGRALRPLDEEVRRVRMLPFGTLLPFFERALRDLSAARGKEAQLRLQGGEVELDRALLERIKDPLLHLLRNAVDHGLEPPARREAAGKPRTGLITLAAALRGAVVTLEVADDGGGLDLPAIRAQAARRGLPADLPERELVRLVFAPGFSTAKLVTDVSGRGIGLDVVRAQVEALHGGVELTSTPGVETRFTLRLPLTLTTVAALLVRAGDETFALPTAQVERLVRATARVSVEGRQLLTVDGQPLPLASLAALLGLPRRAPRESSQAVVLAAEGRRVALLVDELLTEQEVIIKSLGARLAGLRLASGATLLPDGEVALILNASELVAAALRTPGVPPVAARPAPTRRRIVLAEDSVTTRALEKSILEGAGYEVLAAADGAEAWRIIQAEGADLVVSDIEMPRMDGFGLTEAIRQSPRHRELPIVLVTALERAEDKARGLAVGANAYLVKSGFDQEALLATIAQLI